MQSQTRLSTVSTIWGAARHDDSNDDPNCLCLTAGELDNAAGFPEDATVELFFEDVELDDLAVPGSETENGKKHVFLLPDDPGKLGIADGKRRQSTESEEPSIARRKSIENMGTIFTRARAMFEEERKRVQREREVEIERRRQSTSQSGPDSRSASKTDAKRSSPSDGLSDLFGFGGSTQSNDTVSKDNKSTAANGRSPPPITGMFGNLMSQATSATSDLTQMASNYKTKLEKKLDETGSLAAAKTEVGSPHGACY